MDPAGFRTNVLVVSVDFDDFITGRRKLVATTAEHRCMQVNINIP